MLLSFILCNFLVRMLKYKNLVIFFWPQKVEKNHPKKLHTYGIWEFFFSAAPTAQNSQELHFRFINSFIQPSRVESLLSRKRVVLQSPLFFFDA